MSNLFAALVVLSLVAISQAGDPCVKDCGKQCTPRIGDDILPTNCCPYYDCKRAADGVHRCQGNMFCTLPGNLKRLNAFLDDLKKRENEEQRLNGFLDYLIKRRENEAQRKREFLKRNSVGQAGPY
ncbi:uncharacterized protein LOC114522420 [Dendronephthya gigantea]|uniref:uncharacterized protein LOC114522420 n=1 Tax=Dendronephthya gigantea TaxID=151771 RepID=UPI00106DAA20|nr:uncharacterized protein LOC114522420 [Dendronephthya gigantea]XP_028398898.1 uncharacterized protein LOC114522420 [Dendronephthya gigantea]